MSIRGLRDTLRLLSAKPVKHLRLAVFVASGYSRLTREARIRCCGIRGATVHPSTRTAIVVPMYRGPPENERLTRALFDLARTLRAPPAPWGAGDL